MAFISSAVMWTPRSVPGLGGRATITYQLLVSEPLPFHLLARLPDDAESVTCSGTLAVGEFIRVAVQVLETHVMVDSHISALQKRPEGLDPVGVDFVPNVLSVTVSNRIVMVGIGYAGVSRVAIGVDDGFRLDAPHDGEHQVQLVGMADGPCHDSTVSRDLMPMTGCLRAGPYFFLE